MTRRRGAGGRNALGVVLILVCRHAGARRAWAPPPSCCARRRQTPKRCAARMKPLGAHTVILVDTTDRLEARHRRKLRAVLATGARTARRNTIASRSCASACAGRRSPSILFSKCLPRPPEQTNPLFENARMVQPAALGRRFCTARSIDAVRSAGSGGPARASPIVAGLRAVAADPDFGAEIPRRRLVLVSDLLEHNPTGLFTLRAGGRTMPFGAPRPLPIRRTSRAWICALFQWIGPITRRSSAKPPLWNRFWPAFFDAADVAIRNHRPRALKGMCNSNFAVPRRLTLVLLHCSRRDGGWHLNTFNWQGASGRWYEFEIARAQRAIGSLSGGVYMFVKPHDQPAQDWGGPITLVHRRAPRISPSTPHAPRDVGKPPRNLGAKRNPLC